MAYEDSYDVNEYDSDTGVEVSVYIYAKVPDGYSFDNSDALERAAERALLYLFEEETIET